MLFPLHVRQVNQSYRDERPIYLWRGIHQLELQRRLLLHQMVLLGGGSCWGH